MTDTAFAACAALVRKADPDRYFSALAASPEKRLLLFAIYALNCELARIGDNVQQPILGEIRLQWWRDALEAARKGDPRRHDVLEAMARVFSEADLPLASFERMIEA